MGAWGGVGVAECWASQPHNREFRDVSHDQSGGSSSSTTPSVGLRSSDSGPNLLYGSFAAVLVAGQRSQLQCFLATAQAGLSFVSEYPAMTPDQLKAHIASTHPRCEFCRESFYGLDEQYRHMNDKHYSCHICQRQGMPHVYHRVGAGLGAGMAAGTYGANECGPCGSSACFGHGEAPHPASCTTFGTMLHSLSPTHIPGIRARPLTQAGTQISISTLTHAMHFPTRLCVQDAQELRLHMSRNHHLCEEPECAETGLIAFATDEELRQHYLQRHSRSGSGWQSVSRLGPGWTKSSGSQLLSTSRSCTIFTVTSTALRLAAHNLLLVPAAMGSTSRGGMESCFWW